MRDLIVIILEINHLDFIVFEYNDIVYKFVRRVN